MSASHLTIGLLHPGEMGAALGAALRERGHDVLWASAGRSAATRERADRAGLRDAGSVVALARSSDLVVSVCPPDAALDVARAVAGWASVFVDANAVSPATVRAIRGVIEETGGRCVDGGIVGPPPVRAHTTRLYLSGPGADAVAGAFEGTRVEASIVGPQVGAASALKMTYAAWTKGTAALLLAILAAAREAGVEDALLAEWQRSQPGLEERWAQAADAAAHKGWRWVGEMEEIAATFAAAGLPDGFHRAASDVFRRVPELAALPGGAAD